MHPISPVEAAQLPGIIHDVHVHGSEIKTLPPGRKRVFLTGRELLPLKLAEELLFQKSHQYHDSRQNKFRSRPSRVPFIPIESTTGFTGIPKTTNIRKCRKLPEITPKEYLDKLLNSAAPSPAELFRLSGLEDLLLREFDKEKSQTRRDAKTPETGSPVSTSNSSRRRITPSTSPGSTTPRDEENQALGTQRRVSRPGLLMIPDGNGGFTMKKADDKGKEDEKPALLLRRSPLSAPPRSHILLDGITVRPTRLSNLDKPPNGKEKTAVDIQKQEELEWAEIGKLVSRFDRL